MGTRILDHLRKCAQSKLGDETIRLAVTGLSRAGKTVFITSLIHNLLGVARGNKNALPQLFDSGIAERVVSAKIVPAAAEAIARFKYAENLAYMAVDPPRWPSSTEDIALISLQLVMRRKPGAFSKVLSDRKITLEILDYPGEWLMDLPLLHRKYAQWSEETLKAATVGVRADLSSKFRAFVEGLTNSAADEKTAYRAHILYKEYLEACRDRHELRFLQPGRFLRPGPWGDLPLLWFCPLPKVPDKLKSGSLAKLMADRFEAYKADMKAKFFKNHFQKYDRQIVLVDVLTALSAGKDSFEDTRRAIGEIAAQFRYGVSLLLGASGKRIDRVYFAATKADHVPEVKRQHLQGLLERFAGKALQQIGTKRTELGFGTLASVRCTEDGTTIRDGQAVEVVRGFYLDSDILMEVGSGEIPIVLPSDQFWAKKLFKLSIFKPPKLNPAGVTGIPHIDLDVALMFLLGDKL